VDGGSTWQLVAGAVLGFLALMFARSRRHPSIPPPAPDPERRQEIKDQAQAGLDQVEQELEKAEAQDRADLEETRRTVDGRGRAAALLERARRAMGKPSAS